MPETMKVHAYRIEPFDQHGPLEDLLPDIRRDNLDDRVFLVGNPPRDVRVEDIRYRNGHWFMDFVMFRTDHGPGRASHVAPIEGFEFEEGETFGEETACMYVPDTGHLIVQYNHFGPRAGTMQDYFSSYSEDEAYAFDFLPRYDETTERQFQNRASTRKVRYKIDTRFFNDRDRQAGIPLHQALDMANQSGGQEVEVVLSASRSRSDALRSRAERMVEYLMRRAGDESGFVKTLKVGIIPNVDDKTKTLDLIAERLQIEFTDMRVGEDFRFPREERYRALTRAFNGWRQRNIL